MKNKIEIVSGISYLMAVFKQTARIMEVLNIIDDARYAVSEDAAARIEVKSQGTPDRMDIVLTCDGDAAEIRALVKLLEERWDVIDRIGLSEAPETIVMREASE